MNDDPDDARDQTQAAFVQCKALMLFERICKLNLGTGRSVRDTLVDGLQGTCWVSVNLRMIGQLLSLSRPEQAWLETAYVWSCSGQALPNVKIADEAMRWRMLAGVLDQQPSPDVNAWINASQRLRALGLLAPRCYRSDSTHWMGDDLRCCPNVIEVLGACHLSHAHLLNRLLQPQLDVYEDGLLFGGAQHLAYFVNPPPAVADCYRRYRANKPLTVTHLLACLDWWCDWPADANDVKQLAGRIHLPEIRAAIQTAARIACQQQRAITTFDLLKALYAAAA
jgi:hypothetical protein